MRVARAVGVSVERPAEGVRWPMTSRRGRGVELLDDPSVDPETRLRALRDVGRARTRTSVGLGLLGERSWRALARQRVQSVAVLDVGSGMATSP